MWGIVTSFFGGAFSKVIGLFAGKSLMIWLFALAIGGGFAGGYYVSSKFSDAEKADLYAQMAKEQQEAVRRTIAQYEALIMTNNEVMSEYVATINDIRANERVVYKEVTRYVPVEDSVDCNVPVGVVGVLNTARTGDPKWVEMLPAPGESTDAARAPSTVTRREEFEAHVGCGIAYQELKAQLNALIDWIDEAYPEAE